MPLVELLLELADQATLNLLHILPHTEGEIHNDRFACLAHIDLFGSGDVDVAEVSLDVTRWRHLDVKDCLRNLLLQLSGSGTLLLHDLPAGVQHGCDYSARYRKFA